MQAALVAFDAQDIVTFLLHDGRDDGALGAHGVDGDHGPREVEHGQQFRDGGDLVAFVADESLGEGDTGLAGPGAHGMDVGEGVGAMDAVGELEPLAQPAFLEFAKLHHQYVGAHAAEQGREGHEEDLAEVMAGVAAVAGSGMEAKDSKPSGNPREKSVLFGFLGIQEN